jgi:hypothetical protein
MRLTFYALLVATALLFASRASAYPWMIRHDYASCAQCHLDPSGGGPLSAYGRGMGEVLLKTRYDARPAGEEAAEPGPAAKFLWGAVPLPDFLDFGGSLRVASFTDKVDDNPVAHRILFMQADLSAAINTSRWVAVGSIGYAPRGATFASISRGTDSNVISRYHWIGYRLDEDATMLVRAGRMNLPFGVRDVMHTLAVRTGTRTSIDQQQQHGISFAYSGEHFRGELMAVLGNYQVRPDAYRERGYSGYLEWIPSTHAAVGVSSRIGHVNLDPKVLVPMWRHAHGVFGRVATPFKPLVLLGEVDYVIDSPKELPRKQGIQAMAQADLEILQGIHYQLTGEVGDFGPHGVAPSYAAWASFWWFLASHADVRLDGAYQSLASPTGRVSEIILLAQGHLYL